MYKLKQNIGWTLVILLSIVPIILWVFTPKTEPVFTDISTLSASIGEISGLV